MVILISTQKCIFGAFKLYFSRPKNEYVMMAISSICLPFFKIQTFFNFIKILSLSENNLNIWDPPKQISWCVQIKVSSSSAKLLFILDNIQFYNMIQTNNIIIKVESLHIIQQIMMIIITQWLPPQIVGCKTVEILTSSPSANLISTWTMYSNRNRLDK